MIKNKPSPTGGDFLQTVLISNHSGSIKIDVNDDINAMALFIAAPKMLEALEFCLHELLEQAQGHFRNSFDRESFYSRPEIKQLVIAIRKARGES